MRIRHYKLKGNKAYGIIFCINNLLRVWELNIEFGSHRITINQWPWKKTDLEKQYEQAWKENA